MTCEPGWGGECTSQTAAILGWYVIGLVLFVAAVLVMWKGLQMARRIQAETDCGESPCLEDD